MVIKSSGTKATAESRYLSALASEDWTSKQPQKTVFYSVLHYHEAYSSGRLTPTQVAEAILPLIRRDVENATNHSTAFLSTKVELVRKAVEESTARYRAGKPLSPLDGVPMAVKDEEDLAGYTKCLGSKLEFTNKEDVTSYCVQQWLNAGAICLGKTTMHELGMDTTYVYTRGVCTRDMIASIQRIVLHVLIVLGLSTQTLARRLTLTAIITTAVGARVGVHTLWPPE